MVMSKIQEIVQAVQKGKLVTVHAPIALTQRQLDRIIEKINNRPHKALG
jgi:F0F1-type ATP synthase delta subunit